jgi:hypothetical protein
MLLYLTHLVHHVSPSPLSNLACFSTSPIWSIMFLLLPYRIWHASPLPIWSVKLLNLHPFGSQPPPSAPSRVLWRTLMKLLVSYFCKIYIEL